MNATTQNDDVRIVSVDEAPWADVELVFGTRGDPSTCWCQYFKLQGADWRAASTSQCHDALESQRAHDDPPPGVIAYLGDEPAGWCAVEPRSKLPRLARSRVVATGTAESDFDDPSVWAVSCFVVRVGHRRRGVGSALLAGAVAQAERLGARVVEGYPVDTERSDASSAELFHGTLSQFLAAGFELIARPTESRAVVSRTVT